MGHDDCGASGLKQVIGAMNGAIEHYEKADERGEWYGMGHGHVRLYAALRELARIEDAAREATNAAQNAERAAEELAGQR